MRVRSGKKALAPVSIELALLLWAVCREAANIGHFMLSRISILPLFVLFACGDVVDDDDLPRAYAASPPGQKVKGSGRYYSPVQDASGTTRYLEVSIFPNVRTDPLQRETLYVTVSNQRPRNTRPIASPDAALGREIVSDFGPATRPEAVGRYAAMIAARTYCNGGRVSANTDVRGVSSGAGIAQALAQNSGQLLGGTLPSGASRRVAPVSWDAHTNRRWVVYQKCGR